jgi:hypothetical protein
MGVHISLLSTKPKSWSREIRIMLEGDAITGALSRGIYITFVITNQFSE